MSADRNPGRAAYAIFGNHRGVFDGEREIITVHGSVSETDTVQIMEFIPALEQRGRKHLHGAACAHVVFGDAGGAQVLRKECAHGTSADSDGRDGNVNAGEWNRNAARQRNTDHAS